MRRSNIMSAAESRAQLERLRRRAAGPPPAVSENALENLVYREALKLGKRSYGHELRIAREVAALQPDTLKEARQFVLPLVRALEDKS